MNNKLIEAAENGDLNQVKTLVSQGANIHARNDLALQWSANNGHLEVVKFLVSQGADIHARDNCALHWSAYSGHLEVVKFLVSQGADIHAGDDYALHWSARNGHLEVVKFLISQGADIHADNDDALQRSANNIGQAARKMTDHQIELMKHAIGFPKMYRNYFAAGEKDEKDWEELVALGMAKKHINYPNDFYPYPIYTVSPKGIDFLWSMKNGS